MHLHWIAASLIAALFLGIYDLCNKHAVARNAVLPVIFLGTVCSASVWGTLLAVQRLAPGSLPEALVVDPLTLAQHGQILVKSTIVACSWVFTYFAVKHLPVSISGPVRSTGPLWTLAGAVTLLGERPSLVQGGGIAVTLASFFALSLIGREEGIHFHRDKWVAWLGVGTLLGAVSSLYDKHLFGTIGFRAPTVQAWFSIYLALLFLPLAFGWWRRWWPRSDFHWRWSIPGIAGALLVSDYVYFGALRDPEGLVSVVSAIRRSSVLVTFAGGIWLYREANPRRKLGAIAGLLLGVGLIVMG